MDAFLSHLNCRLTDQLSEIARHASSEILRSHESARCLAAALRDLKAVTVSYVFPYPAQGATLVTPEGNMLPLTAPGWGKRP